VWISHTRSADARRRVDLRTSASMNTDVTMPASRRRVTARRAGLLRDDVEAALGRDLVAALGDQHRHLGTQGARDADHLVGRGHLEVELDVRELAQAPHVLVLDVTPVLAQVHGDAVGAAEVRLDGGPHRVRLARAPGLAQRCDMVDVDAELDHDRMPFMECRARRRAPAGPAPRGG
jgi:hypothetical protein